MSNLPRDSVEEILSRVPVESLRAVRFTCKKYNTLLKDLGCVKKHVGQAKVAASKEKEFMVIMMMDFRVYLTRVNLHTNVESCIKHEAKFTSLDNSVKVDVAKVFHCDGLLLYIMKDITKLVVWNPYCGQTRWIEVKPSFDRLDIYLYALGYEKSGKSCRIHKILRFVNFCRTNIFEYKIYDFNSDLWRVLEVTPGEKIHISTFSRGVSLKGDAYWFAETDEGNDCFLLCFDITRESFGPPLSLPFEFWSSLDIVTLSSVREEQLAVLFQQCETLMMELWITTNIEPNAVSWNNKVFLAVNMRPFSYFDSQFSSLMNVSFFIDEEKKVAVVCKYKGVCPTRYVAYILGVDGTLKEVDLGVYVNHCYPLACSYVPSLAHVRM